MRYETPTRERPRFAKSYRAWKYTFDKVAHQTGNDDYDEWGPKEFKAATIIYRNVVQKYGILSGVTMPKACYLCEQTKPFREDDYICVDCRKERE